MALYQKIIKSNYNTTTNAAMESWMANLVSFINESTSLGVTYSVTSTSVANNTGFVLTVPMPGSHITKFGIIMSVSAASSNYFSTLIHNGITYPLNNYGNYFDASNYYAAKVIILHNDDTFYVLVGLSDGEFYNLIALNKMTEIASGNEYWGCVGFVATSPSAYTLQDLTLSRNDSSVDGALSNDISISNAITTDGRFMANNLYSYYLPCVTELPEFLPFNISCDDGEVRNAVILNSCKVNTAAGKSYGSGKYIFFIG